MPLSPRGTAKAKEDIEIANALIAQVSKSRRSPRRESGNQELSISLMPTFTQSSFPEQKDQADRTIPPDDPPYWSLIPDPISRRTFPFMPTALDLRSEFTQYEHEWTFSLSKDIHVKKVLGYVDMKFRQVVSLSQCKLMTKDEAIIAQKVVSHLSS